MKEKTYLSIEEIISLPTLSGTTMSDGGKMEHLSKRLLTGKTATIEIMYGFQKKITSSVPH